MCMNVMSRKGLSWDRLRNFRSVAEAGLIVKAAGGDPVRQSLISRQIRELEQAFEVDLVRRQGRGLALTDAGRRLAMVVRQQAQALQDFDDECREEPVTFSLVGSNTLLDAVFLPQFARLRRELPAVLWRIEHMTTQEAARAVSEGQADFALLRADAVPLQVEKRRLGQWESVLAIPADMDVAGKTIALLLAALPLALPIGGDLRAQLDAYAAKSGITLRPALAVDSFRQALQVLTAGACAAVLPSILLRGAEARVRVVRLPPALRSPRPYALAWRRRLLDTRRRGDQVIRSLAVALAATGTVTRSA